MHFLLDPRSTRWPDIERLTERDIEIDPRRFVGGRNSWIAQTYVRLKPALQRHGWQVTAGAGFVPGSVTIAHRDDANALRAGAHRAFLVVVRADRAPALACDLAIAQNGLGLLSHERFLPLWPQPGLVARDASRGTRITRIAYMGRTGSAPCWFGDPAFHAALARRGVTFEARARDWERYEDVDLVVAVRDDAPAVLASKPATKVYNGWLAGVPVLAGPEPAYREVRRHAIDYLEVADAPSVLAAVDRLRAEPGLYRAMVENGRRRGAEFSVERTAQRWMRLVQEDVLPRYLRQRARPGLRAAWFSVAMGHQKLLSRLHRCRTAFERLSAMPMLN